MRRKRKRQNVSVDVETRAHDLFLFTINKGELQTRAFHIRAGKKV